MEVIGNFDFKGKGKLLRPVLAGTDFPPDPSVGEIIFKDRRLFICIEVQEGLPFWVQLTQELNTYRHNQSVAALEWTIEHNLNTNIVTAQVYDSTGKQVIPDEVDCSQTNTTVIKFNTPTAGVALFMMGDTMGSPKANISHVQSFVNQTMWVVIHNLGYHPNITCIVDSYVVQPQSIVHNSTMQATVTFSMPQTGSVRCV